MTKFPKLPKRGDTVFVKDGNHWLGGIMNLMTTDRQMLIGVTGHSKGAQAVVVNPNDYLVSWCHPGDIDKKSLEAVEKTV
jgi:hypothetical protein